MKVFVTGASGFIGGGISKAFTQAGHTVFGLVRGEDKAKEVQKNEIIPVIGEVSTPETYQKYLDECTVFIHTASGVNHTPYELDKTFIDAVKTSAAKQIYPHGTEKLLILTSGCLIYGGHPSSTHRFAEDEPLQHPPLVEWRRKIEHLVTQGQAATASQEGAHCSAHLYGAVARPGFLYGMSGSYTAPWFAVGASQRQAGLKKPKISLSGSPNKRWPFIHVSDLADGYLRIAEAPRSVVAGQIFNFGDATNATLRDVVVACARVAFVDAVPSSLRKGPEEDVEVEVELLPQGTDAWSNISEQSCLVECSKAARYLHWRPRHQNFLENLPTYYASWKAHQK